MQRQSEQALQLMESAMEVESSVDKIGPIVGPTLDEMAVPHFSLREEGSPAPRFLDTMIALKGQLGASRGRLAEADHKHVEQLRRLIELREQRIVLHDGLYQHVSTARQTVEDLFGKGKAFVIASLEGPTARKSSKLVRQAELAIQRLEQPDLKVPEPGIEGIEVKPETLAKGIKAKSDRLSEVLTEQRELRREAQETRKVKNRALKEHRPLFVNVARALESFYRLAGEEEHADLIRPSLRQKGRRVVDVQTESASEEAASEGSSNEESSNEESASQESASTESTSEESATQESTSADSTSTG